ncbi:LLM class flavin-dependent oxidoreductase [Rhizorhapis suberifaciens]|uniref:Putative F420-dependent oxidoreductase n=1 Tax=Rhizorhapis suberifaciens TaxID=13656 RepID=A0A840HT07_9SPHN|nr:LLM class flavin-dependent oxidoreductase [Rhizorhapis suberifaciens]MBB4640644.1 putative F420-dependent oxidoreductase [Rhizorhapis suberifaciens]
MPLIGVLLNQHAYDLQAEALAKLAVSVEALGYESVWLLDSFSRDPYLAASFILGSTKTLKVGTGVATVYSRDAMAAVQARETLSEYYPGRFLMGMGASNETIVSMRKGQWMPPVKKMTTYLEDMEQVQLAHPKPAQLAPLHMAAHAPGLQNLAMKHASGIFTWILPAENVRQARAHVGPDLEVTANFPVILNENADEARRIARAFMMFYITIPYYQAAYSKIGFNDADFKNGGSDRLMDAIVAWGSPEKIKARVEEYAAAGASRVVINPIRAAEGEPVGGERDVDADWDGLSALTGLLR